MKHTNTNGCPNVTKIIRFHSGNPKVCDFDKPECGINVYFEA